MVLNKTTVLARIMNWHTVKCRN